MHCNYYYKFVFVPLSVVVYYVTVHTGDHWAANTDATLWVNLHGNDGDTGRRVLYHSLTEDNGGAMFTNNRKDVFKVEAVPVGPNGELKMVEIGHDGVGYGKIYDVGRKFKPFLTAKLGSLMRDFDTKPLFLFQTVDVTDLDW